MKNDKYISQLTYTDIESFLSMFYNVVDIDMRQADDGNFYYRAIVSDKNPNPMLTSMQHFLIARSNIFPTETTYGHFYKVVAFEDFVAYEGWFPFDKPIDLRDDWYNFMLARFADQGYQEDYQKAYEEQQKELAGAENSKPGEVIESGAQTEEQVEK